MDMRSLTTREGSNIRKHNVLYQNIVVSVKLSMLCYVVSTIARKIFLAMVTTQQELLILDL